MADTPAESAFQEAVIEQLTVRAPHCRIGVLPGLRLRVALTDGRVLSLGLLGAFRAFLETGGRFEDLEAAASAHVQHALEALPPGPSVPGGAPAGYDEIKSKVLPLLEAQTFFEATDEAARDAPRLLRAPVVPGELVMAFVLPGKGGSMRFLSERDAEEFKKDPTLIEHDARANLARRIQGRLTLTLHHGVCARVEETPWFRPTLLLVPAFRSQLADVLGPAPLVALPARDELHAFDASERAAWGSELPKLDARYQAAPQPLSPGLFCVEPGGLALAGNLL